MATTEGVATSLQPSRQETPKPTDIDDKIIAVAEGLVLLKSGSLDTSATEAVSKKGQEEASSVLLDMKRCPNDCEEGPKARIVPLSVGQKSMDYIFGKDAHNEINSARNGLWLPGLFEEQFDKFQVVIVPTGEPRQWQVLVVDKDGVWNSTAYVKDEEGEQAERVTFGDLHGAKLVFQNDAQQPRARYFYFHYLCAMLKRSERMKEKGLSMNDLETAGMPQLSRVWASEGSYLRDNVILGFIERLGDSLGKEGEEMIRSHSCGSVPPDETENLISSIAGMELESDEDGDEDEDDE
ncbi:hypothetical protein FQN54_008472 [Arachnomyces sp. PD_36]|nr:hypothetical protein FQN54_008472 [Arachnomyces sp. PD_36]